MTLETTGRRLVVGYLWHWKAQEKEHSREFITTKIRRIGSCHWQTDQSNFCRLRCYDFGEEQLDLHDK